jgi:hypothetical protein
VMSTGRRLLGAVASAQWHRAAQVPVTWMPGGNNPRWWPELEEAASAQAQAGGPRQPEMAHARGGGGTSSMRRGSEAAARGGGTGLS